MMKICCRCSLLFRHFVRAGNRLLSFGAVKKAFVIVDGFIRNFVLYFLYRIAVSQNMPRLFISIRGEHPEQKESK